MCGVVIQIRSLLEQHMSCSLKEYKEFMDKEMLLVLGQLDKATLIFDHLYLVRTLLAASSKRKCRSYASLSRCCC